MKYYFRGWIAIECIQLLGTLFQLITNAKGIEGALFAPNQRISPAFVHLFVLLCIQGLALKLLILFGSENKTLLLIHATFHLLYLAYLTVELFLFHVFALSTAALTHIALSVFSILFAFSYLYRFDDNLKDSTNGGGDRKQPRKLIAKHYMESQLFSDNERKSFNNVQESKKRI